MKVCCVQFMNAEYSKRFNEFRFSTYENKEVSTIGKQTDKIFYTLQRHTSLLRGILS